MVSINVTIYIPGYGVHGSYGYDKPITTQRQGRDLRGFPPGHLHLFRPVAQHPSLGRHGGEAKCQLSSIWTPAVPSQEVRLGYDD